MSTSLHAAAHVVHAATPAAGSQLLGVLGFVGFFAFWGFVFRSRRRSGRN